MQHRNSVAASGKQGENEVVVLQALKREPAGAFGSAPAGIDLAGIGPAGKTLFSIGTGQLMIS